MVREDRREKLINRVENMLRRADQPRFQMSIIVLITGGVGFVASYGLLHAGLNSMAIRYPVSIAVAYLAFLGLLRLWLRYRGVRFARGSGSVDLPDLDVGGIGHRSAQEVFTGGGGHFGGGGATASFDAPSTPTTSAPTNFLSAGAGKSDGGGWFIDLDLDELWLVLIALAMALCAALAGLYIIYVAPGLLAEILVDSALAAGLYKRLKKDDTSDWLTTAVKRTWLPAGGLAVVCTVGGHFFQKLAPQAKSIGYLFH